ncbi:MAG: hypothetical protein H0W68_02755 [Gemmatimonadaceae bacterium]|nr:hypothetical protein [Gemmatimonadaceae bacterium]
MDDPIINTTALRQPRNRQLLIIIGAAVLGLLIILAIWQSTGTHGAKRDLASASDRVAEKQKEVDDAQRLLDQRIAELRAARAEALAQATKLGGVVDERVQGVVDDARPDASLGEEYYVRDRHGNFVRAERPRR